MNELKKFEHSLLNVLCRICGKEDKYCLQVFSDEGIQQQLQKKIRLCLPIVISEDDEMPKQVCISCLNKLESTYELYTMCKLAQDDIRKKLNYLIQSHTHGSGNTETSYASTIEEKCKTLSEERPIQIGGSIIKLIKPTAVTTPKHVPPQSISSSTHVGMNSITSNVNMQSSHGQNMVAVSAPKQLSQADTTTLPEMVIQQPQVIVPAHYVSHVPSDQLTQTGIPVQGQYCKQSNPQYEQHVVQQPVFQQTVMQQQNSNAKTTMVETSQQLTANSAQAGSVLKKKRLQESNRANDVTNTAKKKLSKCRYCHKMFSDDIIDHHVNLHLHQSFFTCIDCNKNFRSEDALEKHRCRIIS